MALNVTHLPSTRSRVLVVEDEPNMAVVLESGLEDRNYSVTPAGDGVQGFDLAKTEGFAAIILEVKLPLLDAYSVASLLRAHGIATPILILTAMDSIENVISGLDPGAEDHMTKPISFIELLARLRALVRRNRKQIQAQLHVGDLILDPS